MIRKLTREKIKKRYGELAKIYHPDKQKDRKGNSDKFIEIQNAYELLTSLFQNSEMK